VKFKKLKFFATIFSIAAIGAGCANTRDTTTSRTPIEQALMSQTARESIDYINPGSELAGMSYKIDDSKLISADKDVILAQVEEKLLRNGLVKATGDDADITITPYAEYSAIDDGTFLIGLPSIILPAPGGGQVPLPELALVKRAKQEGKNKIALYGTSNEDGSLKLAHDPNYSERYYSRYTFLFLIRFNKTDLDQPFPRNWLF